MATTQYDEALRSLARAIRKHRRAGAADETARRLLDVDNPGHVHLVGIDYAATRAVFYHCGDRYAIAVGFDDDGLDDGGPRLGTFRDRPLRPWIDRWGAFWGWLHPRYCRTAGADGVARNHEKASSSIARAGDETVLPSADFDIAK